MNKLIVRAKLAAKILRFLPFVEMVGLNGSVVRGQEKDKSDIDILIIAKKGRLYTCRFFSVISIHLTGWRRHGSKTAGRICLNCYLNSSNPNVFPQNKQSAEKVARAYKYLIPLVDNGSSAEKFYRHNKWLIRFKVNGKKYSRDLKQKHLSNFPLKPLNSLMNRILGGKIGDYIEDQLMKAQINKIIQGKKTSDEIVVTKNEIRLHPKKNN